MDWVLIRGGCLFKGALKRSITVVIMILLYELRFSFEIKYGFAVFIDVQCVFTALGNPYNRPPDLEGCEKF